MVIAYHPPKYNRKGVLIEEASREPVTKAMSREDAFKVSGACNTKSCVRIATTLGISRLDAEGLMLCRFGVEVLSAITDPVEAASFHSLIKAA